MNYFQGPFRRRKRVPTSFRALAVLFILVLFLAYLMAQKAEADTDMTQDTLLTHKAPQIEASGLTVSVTKPQKPTNAHIATVTCFSSSECHTSWCRKNAGQPRGLKVALNGKYGKHAKVHIPTYGKTYDVIGTTDFNTDVDVWLGDDGQAARECGRKDLQIILLD